MRPSDADVHAALDDLRRAQAVVVSAERELNQARLDMAASLRVLHAAGMTFQALGKMLGVSRQRAAQLSRRGVKRPPRM